MAAARYIAVDGPIGVGKTRISLMLAKALGARLVEEPAENPFLASYYADRQRGALQSQLWFLLARYQQQKGLCQSDLFSPGGVICDYLFIRDHLYAGLTLSPEELILYKKVYGLLAPAAPRPDLVIYLQARPEVLLGRVRDRGRAHERFVTLQDVEEIGRAYREFFFHWAESPLLVVDTSEVDLAGDPRELESLLAIIRKHKGGVQHYIPLGSRRP